MPSSRRPRRSSILAVLAVATLMMGSTAPPAPAQSRATLVLAPASGPDGTVVDAAADALPVGATHQATLRFRGAVGWPELAAGVPITDKGTFETTFVVPRGFPTGDHVVEVCVQRGGTGPETCDRMPTARFRVTERPSATSSSATTAPAPSSSSTSEPVAPSTTEGVAVLPTTSTLPSDLEVTTTAGPPPTAAGALLGPSTTHGLGLGELTGSGQLPDLAITGMEITQGIQNLDNDMPLVADRTTVVRVYVKTDGASMPSVSGLLQLVRDGSVEVAVLEPDNGPLTVDGDPPDRLDADGSLSFTLPPAATTATSQGDRLVVTAFVFSTHPTTPATQEPTDANNYEADVFELHPTGDLTVHVLPMHMHEQPTSAAPDATYGTSATDLFALAATLTSLYRYYPVSGVSAVMGPTIQPPYHGLEAPWPGAMTEWDLTVDGVEASILGQVQDVWAQTSTTSHLDQYYGIYREDLPRTWGGFSNGTVAYGYYDLTFGDTKPWYHRAGWLAAHELGHSIGFAHVACKGTEGNPGSYPWSDPCSLAPVDPAGYYGWDIRHDAFAVTDGPTVISQAPGLYPDNGYPFMGYQSPKWTDPWHYCRALVKLDVDCAAVAIPENEVGPTDGPDLAATVPYQPADGQTGWLEITAVSHEVTSPPDSPGATSTTTGSPIAASRFSISVDGVQVVPDPLPHVLQAMADRRARGVPSGVTAAVVDGAGGVLAELELVETMEGADPTQTEGSELEPEAEGPGVTAMSDYLPWFDAAVGVQLRVGGEVVDERRPSVNPPTLEVVSPAGGDLTFPLTIEWKAADADGDDLTFDLAYSPDGGITWSAVASDLHGTQHTLADGSLLAGGSEATFRVTARDGFHTTTATSAGGVLPDQPPQVIVLSPGDDATVPLHRAVTLLVSAWDAEGGEPPTITWTSDRDGPVGTGAQLVTGALSAGDHLLTATATDQAGGTAVSSVRLRVDATGALERLDADGFAAGLEALRDGPVHAAALETDGAADSAFGWWAGALAAVALIGAGAAVRRGRAVRAEG